ncbi:MAG: class I SAM-dependent methyltransferase, partial [Methanobacteriota archaeon]
NRTFKYSPSKLIRERWILYLLKRQVVFSTSDSLLDLGCGRGSLLRKVLKSFPSAELYGADYSEKAITENKKELPTIKFMVLDFEQDNLEAAFPKIDCIVSQEVIEHLDKNTQANFLKAIYNMLPKGGWAIVTTPDWESIQSLRKNEETDVEFAKRFEGQPNANILTRKQLVELATKAGFNVVWHQTVCPYVKNRYLTNLLDLMLFLFPPVVEMFILNKLGVPGKYQVSLLKKEI